MKKWSLVVLFLVSGCTKDDFERFASDVDNRRITELWIEDRGEKMSCDPSAGQKLLKAWKMSLREADSIASWPDPGQYLTVSFDNGNKYSARLFIGGDSLPYSVVYMSGVRVGDALRIKDVCTRKGAHNNALNTDGLGQRAYGASPNPAG